MVQNCVTSFIDDPLDTYLIGINKSTDKVSS